MTTLPTAEPCRPGRIDRVRLRLYTGGYRRGVERKIDAIHLGSQHGYATRRFVGVVSVAVLITLACGGGTTTAPATPAPSPIAPAAAPTTVEIAPTVASIPSSLSVANAFFQAFNGGDVGALSRLHSLDVIQTFGPVPARGVVSISGLPAVLQDNGEHINLHAHYTPSNIRAVGNTVTSQFTYRDEGLERRGVASLSGPYHSAWSKRR